MILHIILGLISLIIILIACEFFSNSAAWAIKKYSLGRGPAGRILSVMATALPETIIPLTALLLIPGRSGAEMAQGAILGAPLMLSTLAFGITGITAAVLSLKDKTRGAVIGSGHTALLRGLLFFTVTFTLAIIFSWFHPAAKKAAAVVFLVIYAYYLHLCAADKVVDAENQDGLYFSPGANPAVQLVVFQLAAAAGGIVLGAGIFVDTLKYFSAEFRIDAFLLALFAAPFITEFPDSLNIVSRLKQKKDDAALSGIAGALVFQSCVVVFAGLVATPWDLSNTAKVSALIAIVSAAYLAAYIKIFKKLHAAALIVPFLFYILFILFAVKGGF